MIGPRGRSRLLSVDKWNVDLYQRCPVSIFLYSAQFLFDYTLMRTSPLSSLKSYDPNRLIDALLNNMNVKNDSQLSKILELPPSSISKIRRRQMAVSSETLIAMHETSGLSIRELRELMGDTRRFF
jgi:hypothetical protein